ncbi:MAG: hypothetical protein HVN35_09970 [Methanobacteriaceae archaeon]|nr:hypothetical protein [Methanobacteriaceae archaeon]
MRLDDKGMATAELLFVTLIALVIIAAMLSLVSNMVNQEQIGSLGESRMTGEGIAEALNTVYTNGNGYSVVIRLDSEPAFGALISSSGNSSTLTIMRGDKNVTIPLIPKQFVNNYTLNSGKNYKISNINNTIIIIEL